MTDTKPLALIIEDNEDQNLIFTTALTQAGYATESIRDGTVALDRLNAVTPTMVILDLHVPGVNGGVILREIRKAPRTQNAHVIIVSADAEFASSLQAQVDLVLLKPVSFSQLSHLASRYIKESKSP
ncbi:MAG TPA: response regulator [Anaerolineales bacterium]|nr:response regulator [Anaerolineales bacterium]